MANEKRRPFRGGADLLGGGQHPTVSPELTQRGIVPIQQHPAKSVSTDPAVLADLARQIRVCMRKSDDYRVTAACHLAQAKVHCRAAKRPFKDWVARELGAKEGAARLGYTEAVRLAKIGASDDPAKALADLRAKTRTSVAKRKAKVALASATPAQLTMSLKAAREAYLTELARDNVPLDVLHQEPRLLDKRLHSLWRRRIADATPEEIRAAMRPRSKGAKAPASAPAFQHAAAVINATGLFGGGVS
ncbi:MAG: hypothetical protein ACR2JJ_05080 [Sphingomicrobium sp.]